MPINNCIIAPLEPAFLQQAADLHQEVFSDPWSYNSLKAELEKPSSQLIAAYIDGKFAGLLIMGSMFSQGYINSMAVPPALQRQGIASLLMEWAIHHAYEQGLDSITLEVRKSNIAAQKLYEKFGFAVEGERQGFYIRPLESALVMTRRL